MNNTSENLKAAFAGESQANRRYTAFSRKAEQEGYKQIAKLFRAAAEGETVHALNHFNTMQGVKTTEENLQEAIKGEYYEFTKMYPEFIAQAKEDKDEDAVETFEEANKVEPVHHANYLKALESIKQGEDMEETEYWVCQHCGNLFAGETPEHCPVCGHPKKEFKKID